MRSSLRLLLLSALLCTLLPALLVAADCDAPTNPNAEIYTFGDPSDGSVGSTMELTVSECPQGHTSTIITYTCEEAGGWTPSPDALPECVENDCSAFERTTNEDYVVTTQGVQPGAESTVTNAACEDERLSPNVVTSTCQEGSWSAYELPSCSDQTAPVITIPDQDTVLEATSAAGTDVDFSALVSAEDAVVGTVAVQCAYGEASFLVETGSTQTMPVGSTSVTCTATDGTNEATSDSFDVVVQDTTAPAITLTAQGPAAEATSAAGAEIDFNSLISAADVGAVSEPVTIECTYGDVDAVIFTVTASTTQTMPLGSNEVTCTATDAAGNDDTSVFTVAVVDTTAPVVTVPESFTVDANQEDHTYTANLFSQFSVSDAVSSDLSIECTSESGLSFTVADSDLAFPIGEHEVTCTSTEDPDKVGSASFHVTVNARSGTSWTAHLPSSATPRNLQSANYIGESFDVSFPSSSAKSVASIRFSLSGGSRMEPDFLDHSVRQQLLGETGSVASLVFKIVAEDGTETDPFTINWGVMPSVSTSWTAEGQVAGSPLLYPLTSATGVRTITLPKSAAGQQFWLTINTAQFATLSVESPVTLIAPASKQFLTQSFTVTSQSGLQSTTQIITIKTQ